MYLNGIMNQITCWLIFSNTSFINQVRERWKVVIDIEHIDEHVNIAWKTSPILISCCGNQIIPRNQFSVQRCSQGDISCLAVHDKQGSSSRPKEAVHNFTTNWARITVSGWNLNIQISAKCMRWRKLLHLLKYINSCSLTVALFKPSCLRMATFTSNETYLWSAFSKKRAIFLTLVWFFSPYKSQEINQKFPREINNEYKFCEGRQKRGMIETS